MDAADATVWKAAIELSRNGEGASPVAAATTDLAFKNNFDNEFMMAWGMLMAETFDKDSEERIKF